MRRGLAALACRVGVERESGATAVEYAFIVALIAAVVIAGVALVGAATTNNFGTVNI